MAEEIPLPAEGIPPSPPQTGGKEDLFQKQKNLQLLPTSSPPFLWSLQFERSPSTCSDTRANVKQKHWGIASEISSRERGSCKNSLQRGFRSDHSIHSSHFKWEKRPAILQPKDVVYPDRNKEFRGEASQAWMWLLNWEQLGEKMVFNRTVLKNREKEGEEIGKR